MYIGRSIDDLPAPVVIIDVAKVKENCQAMLNAVTELGVSFRAHVKTHKTSEISRLQVGEDCKDVRLIVSTVIEAENVVPLLLEYQRSGAKVNLLYGVPLGPSHVERLARVASELGPGSVAVMIDHPDQLSVLHKFRASADFPASVFIKTDSGYHRAGLGPQSPEMVELVRQVSAFQEKGDLHLLGFYSHNSLSYGGSSPDDAMAMLKVEIDVCREAAQHLTPRPRSPLIVSVGASPTALSLQNILPSAPSSTASAMALQDTLELAKSNLELEVHAGVYPLFDMQQVAAASRHFTTDPHDSIAVTVLTEVCSLYPRRTDIPEALISAGTLALAREPCKDYPGWGVITPWNMPRDYTISRSTRMIVSRISQEHGVIVREDKEHARDKGLPVVYGQKVRIWPNHACITLAMFGWYFVVDSSTSKPDTVVDVWLRWRGW